MYIVDRIEDMIITGGENVYSPEVEAAVISYPSVLQCAVVGLPDQNWGERVHAVLVIEDGNPTPTLEQIRDHVNAHIARYEAPNSIQVVPAYRFRRPGRS